MTNASAAYDTGRRTVFAVLREEYRAHRGLWLSLLAFTTVAAGISPVFIDGATICQSLASGMILLSALQLLTLNLLRLTLRTQAAQLPETDANAFRRGAASALRLASLPAVFAIIVSSTAYLA